MAHKISGQQLIWWSRHYSFYNVIHSSLFPCQLLASVLWVFTSLVFNLCIALWVTVCVHVISRHTFGLFHAFYADRLHECVLELFLHVHSFKLLSVGVSLCAWECVLSWKRHRPDRAVKLSLSSETREFQTISQLMLRNMLAIPAEAENHRIYK